MVNDIAKDSKLYTDLLDAYEIENKILRFNTCYDLVEASTYMDVLFVISRLKELDVIVDSESILVDTLKSIVDVLMFFIGNKSMRRRAYLLDILEEA